MKIIIKNNFNKTKWLHRLFRFLPCRHNTVLVEENYDSKYGTHTSYIYCLECGRKAMDIERNCKHELNSFGDCFFCKSKIIDYCEDKLHEWVNEPDTDDRYCEKCGEWDYMI